MEEYRKALSLRKEGNYEEAYDWLTKAYKAGSLYAKYELLHIYYDGGWGVCAGSVVKVGYSITMDEAKKDPVLSLLKIYQRPLEVTERLIQLTILNSLEGITSESIASNYFYRKEYNIGIEWLMKGAGEGCAKCSYSLWSRTGNWDCLLVPHQQRLTNASSALFHRNFNNCKYNEAFAIHAYNGIADGRVVDFVQLVKTNLTNPPVMYFIGKAAPRMYNTENIRLAREHYNIRYQRVKQATLTWMCIATRRLGIYKDVAKMIGKMVFASRENFNDPWDGESFQKRARRKRRIKF